MTQHSMACSGTVPQATLIASGGLSEWKTAAVDAVHPPRSRRSPRLVQRLDENIHPLTRSSVAVRYLWSDVKV